MAKLYYEQQRLVWSRLAWIRHYEEQSHNVSTTCRHFHISRPTFYKWYKRFLEAGQDRKTLQDRSHRPRFHPKTTPPNLVAAILKMRAKTGYGPRRLAFFLTKEGLSISVFAVYRVLARQGLILKYKKRPKTYRRYSSPYPGHCFQVDIKYVPIKLASTQLYQYSAIDDCSRWRFAMITEERSNYHSLLFLKELLKAAPFPIKTIQTDNDAVFTNLYTGYPKTHPLKEPRPHPFTALCEHLSIRHRLIKPATPRLNGKIERAHRSDEEEFYRPGLSFSTIAELQGKLKKWLLFYNHHRPHGSLGYISPNQFLKSFSIAEGVNNH